MTIKKVRLQQFSRIHNTFLLKKSNGVKYLERVTDYPKMPPQVVTGIPPVVTGGLRWSTTSTGSDQAVCASFFSFF